MNHTCFHDSSLRAWADSCAEIYVRFRVTLTRMRRRGWEVRTDPVVAKHYKALEDTHKYARKGDLEAVIECCGRTTFVTCFQNLNYDNRAGGRYDSGKLARMPRFVRNQCIVELRELALLWEVMGFPLTDEGSEVEPTLRNVRDLMEERFATPLDDFNRRWDRKRFKRDENGWPVPGEFRGTDRDGKPILNGQTKYMRYRGRLARGTVYTNMNDRWGFYVGGKPLTYVNDSELFDCDRPDLEPRRAFPPNRDRLEGEVQKALRVNDYARVRSITYALEATP